MRIHKGWLAVTIVLTLTIFAYVWGSCVEQRKVGASPRERDVEIGTALSGERTRTVTELKPISKKFGHRIVTTTVTETTRREGRVVERSRTEETGDCISHRITGENLICLYQKVYWKWRYNFDLHRASWVDVDWGKRIWRDNMLSNWWNFRSWDGTASSHGEYPSAGENLQWKERQVWATVEYCFPLGGCTQLKQLTIGQHIRNYDDGHFHSFAGGHA